MENKTFSAYATLVSMVIRCIEGNCMHDSDVIRQCYIQGLNEQQAIEVLYTLRTYSSALKTIEDISRGSALNDCLTDKPFLSIEKERFEGLSHLNFSALITAGGTIVKLDKRVHSDRMEYGIIPIALSEIGLATRMTQSSSRKDSFEDVKLQQELTGDQFHRVLRRNRIPLSSFASTVNTTIDRLKTLKNDKPVPQHFIQTLDNVYQIELA